MNWRRHINTLVAVALVVSAVPGFAAAQQGQGAPIVFARRDAAPALRPAVAVSASARVEPVSARTAPRRAANPPELYGYGAVPRRTAPAVIDLRGGFSAADSVEPMAAEAFDTATTDGALVVSDGGATPAASGARTAPPSPVPQRPEWLEQERTGAPYQAFGQWYVPTAEPGYAETGSASWYGADYHGRRTASGEVFDAEALTAAHPTLPIPSLVQVTNLENGREVIVRVNDRGPFHAGRLIDVSRRTAEVLGFEQAGQARVHVRYLGPAPKRVDANGGDVAAPPVSATPSETPPAAAGAYVVQVGAFSSPVNAERARVVASQAGAASVDMRPAASGAVLHRVRVGAWTTRAEAEAARATVAGLGFPGAVVALR